MNNTGSAGGRLVFSLIFMLLSGFFAAMPATGAEKAAPVVKLPKSADRVEVERLIINSLKFPAQRRVEFVSRYLIGRKYHPETKDRIKKQSGVPVEKKEAVNADPMPVTALRTSMAYLDCMTYVEHVLAITSCTRAAYEQEFLCRLIDIMFDAGGAPLMNHHRNHFTSHWGDVNERKGYLVNVARNHPQAVMRELILNKVADNRTFYIEDRFMIAQKPMQMWYFPVAAILDGRFQPASGDVVAMVTDKEGLDVTHMGFYIEHTRQRWLRHASIKLNRVVDQDFDQYLRNGKHIRGLMVFRPLLKAPQPPHYRFVRK